jgi:putative SOS response-associated peptidase YedK
VAGQSSHKQKRSRGSRPLILNEKDYEPWLSGKAGLKLLKPAAENVLQKRPVSKRVNSSRAPDDDPTLIERVTL